jgi:predicted metalloprotease with PDZ domain
MKAFDKIRLPLFPKILIAAVASALLFPASVAAAQAREPGRYELSWTAENFPVVSVSAELDVVDGAITMFSGLNDAFAEPRGFAAFVRDLEVSTADGRVIRAVPDDQSGWTLPGFNSGRIRLRYKVDFSYASERFATGNEQIALLEGRGVFATGFALFITSGLDGPAEVAIEAPPSWDVTTAWARNDDGRYSVPDKNGLLRNMLAVGRGYYSERLVRSGVELRIVLFGYHAGAAAAVRAVFLPVMDSYVRLFRHDEPGQFAFAILPGPNDGEGYINSFASSQPLPPAERDRLVWANSLAHEFFHFWNGSRIASTWDHYPERQWFSEGFTEYYANRALLETGIIDEATYSEILSQYLSMHLLFATNSNFANITMREAGRSKGRYRPGVYDSGVAAAFCLDGMIRSASDDRRALDDLMRLLDTRFGSTGQPLVFEDIATAASEVLGEDRRDFFTQHIEGREPLPVANCAEEMGYRAIIDGYHVFLRPE